MTHPATYGVVYRLTNTVNGKVYIGQTTGTAKERWATHVYATKQKCRLLGRAIKKHGPQAFTVETLQSLPDRESLDNAERFFIWACNGLAPAGYNLSTGGESGFKQSAETCRLKSEFHRKRYEDPAQRERQGQMSRAHWSRPEVKAKASESHARYWTEERRAEQSALGKLKVQPHFVQAQRDSVKARRIPVIVTSIASGESHQFASGAEACLSLGLDASKVSLCITGKRSHHKGFKIESQRVQ